MTEITNAKVKSLRPEWSSFSGMSLLFDNPGDSLSPLPGKGGLGANQINCSPDIPFYQRINRCLEERYMDLPADRELFCRLPYSSYHVTVNDLAHQANLKDFKPASRALFSQIFASYPTSLNRVAGLNPFLQKSKVLQCQNWNIRFQLSHLDIWSDSVLVVSLKTADQKSQEYFEKLVGLRKIINDDFQSLHGYSSAIREQYNPHLTLGYLGNRSYAKRFRPYLQEWNRYFTENMKDDKGEILKIEFNSISLYGFMDMATFFKIA